MFLSRTHTHTLHLKTEKKNKETLTKLIKVIRAGVALNEVVYYPPWFAALAGTVQTTTSPHW